jgi:hypothetical protein
MPPTTINNNKIAPVVIIGTEEEDDDDNDNDNDNDNNDNDDNALEPCNDDSLHHTNNNEHQHLKNQRGVMARRHSSLLRSFSSRILQRKDAVTPSSSSSSAAAATTSSSLPPPTKTSYETEKRTMKKRTVLVSRIPITTRVHDSTTTSTTTPPPSMSSSGTAVTAPTDSDELSTNSTTNSNAVLDVSLSSSSHHKSSTTNARTPSTRRSIKRFNPEEVQMTITLSIDDMTLEEKEACWYTSDEKVETKLQANECVQSFSITEFEGMKVDTTSFVTKTLERTYASLKKVSYNCVVSDTRNVMDEDHQAMIDDLFINPTTVSRSSAVNREYMQIAHRSLHRWIRHVNTVDEASPVAVSGLEKMLMKKLDCEIIPCRRKVLQQYYQLKLSSSPLDSYASNHVADDLSHYAQELSLTHRLYSRLQGDIVSHYVSE